ncbi:MAG: PorP/SprF family type IX secretion system membrane protein [Bacteroidales bacterium]|nr:PorP/SprF family type IX secretion system membrane protein [Bacteroidales bacterium]
MKRFIIFFIYILLGLSARPQDPNFTQFYSCPLFLGPSFAGGIAGHRTVVNYRNQWIGIKDAYQTASLSWDHNFINFHSGLGLSIIRDQAGSGKLGNTRGGILYSYDLTPLPEWHLRPGLGFYLVQTSIDFSSLIFGDQLTSDDSSIPTTISPPNKRSIYDIDVASSLLIYSDNVWIGTTWDHMLQPTTSFYNDQSRLPFKFSVYGGIRRVIRGFILSKIEESITGAFYYRKQGDFQQLDLGLYWFSEPISFGVWYRGLPISKTYKKFDAIAFMVGYKFEQVSFAYSYDFTVSKLGFNSGGSHEISFIYEFKVSTKRRWKPIPCPTF